MNPPVSKPPRHYPTPSAKCADLCVHVAGLTAALIGGIVLLVLTAWTGTPATTASGRRKKTSPLPSTWLQDMIFHRFCGTSSWCSTWSWFLKGFSMIF